MKPFTSVFSMGLILPFILIISGCTDESLPSTSVTTEESTTIENPVIVNTTITKAGTYTFAGKIDPIVIDVTKEDDIEIILNNVEISSDSEAPIYIKQAKDVTIILAENSVNTITDNRTEIEEEDPSNSAIFSKSDLKIKGEDNSLLVVNAHLNDGISSNDDLEFKDAIIEVLAKDDAIVGKDSIEVKDSTLSVTSDGDGFKVSNNEDEDKGFVIFEDSTVTISVGDDGVHAASEIHFKSGQMDILKSYEGLESQLVTIDGGTINIKSEDDAINIAQIGYSDEESASEAFTGGRGQVASFPEGKLIINGGTLTVDSSGDGLDSNGSILINGGQVFVEGPTASNEGALDTNEALNVAGGVLLAVGSVGMSQVPDDTSAQPVIQINLDEVQVSGTQISLQDQNGLEIFSYTPSKQFQSITYSSSALTPGQTYDFLINGVKSVNLTLDGTITKYGEGETKGGPGGR